MSDAVVDTTVGRVRGTPLSGGVLRFAGVPYGDPTGGENRFRPPRPRTPWAGTRDAADFGRRAPQGPQLDGVSEDCLTLNIWTPSRQGRRPVLVWFHGGGFSAGAARTDETDGTALAATGDAVVVSVAHRLGILGFLHLEDLCGDELAGSGNASLLDLVAALSWIRDNIAGFGGDPDAVTIHGHSGGGGKVSALCAMPAAKGLFRRAVVHGGPPIGFTPRPVAHDTAERALEQLDVAARDPWRLAALPLERVMAAQWELGVHGVPGPHGMRFAPTLSTDALPADPSSAFAAGAASDIDLMIGTALDESRAATFAYPAYLEGAAIDDDSLIDRLRPGLDSPDDAEPLVAAYRELDPSMTNVELFLAATSDHFRVRSLRLAGAKHAGDGRPSWVYLSCANQDDSHGAFHGIEMPLFFRNATPSTPAAAVAEALSAELIAFARGELGASGVWRPYTPLEPDQLVISDSRLETVRAPRDERVRLWDPVALTPRTDPWTTLWLDPR